MNFALQILSKFVRKKFAVWVFFGVIVLFIICAYSGGVHKHEPDGFRDSYAGQLVGVHKRLQQSEDTGVEPVQFLPGVPGHIRGAMKNPEDNRNEIFEKEAIKHNHRAYKVRNQQEEYRGIVGEQQPLHKIHQNQIQNIADNVEYDNLIAQFDNNNNNRNNFQTNFNNNNNNNFNSYDNNVINNNDNYNSNNRPAVYFNQGLNNDMAPSGSVNGPTEPPEPYIAQQRIVHFDLKGAPPKVSYLKKILPMLKQLGATGILWEWEDTFPFTGRLEVAAVKNHYTVSEVKELLATCADLGLESIPLVQTFGHMEFILKLSQFQHLRDHQEMPESICPCHNETYPLIKDYISQVMKLHQNARYLHIGCDEVYHLGTCAPCLDQSRTSLFTGHVSRIAKHVSATYGVKPIIWDDMLRNFMEEEMMPLATLVEPMVWVYAEDVYRFMPSYTWDRFAAVFPTVWTASAFKGAHGETLVVPDSQRHLNNNVNWITVMREQEHKFKEGIKGIVITGWQRFDHFAVLCELLPAAVPSLFLDLVTVTHGYYNSSLDSTLTRALTCPDVRRQEALNLEMDNFLWNALSWCYFPGSAFFRITEKLVMLEKEVNEFIDKVSRKKGWLTQYNKDHKFSSPFRIAELMEDWSRIQHDVVSLMKHANTALAEVYDHHTQGEWIEQKIYPMYKKLSKMRQESDALLTRRTWQQRPFPIPNTLIQMGIGVEPTTSPPPPSTPRLKRRVQQPDLYSSKGRLRALGHR